MRYFVNTHYTIEMLREEFRSYCKTMHPNFGGNPADFRELLNEYTERRKALSKRYKDTNDKRKIHTTYDPTTPPAEGMKLVNTRDGVAIYGDINIIYNCRKNIMMHGGKWNPSQRRWEATTEGGIKELRRWFGLEPKEPQQRVNLNNDTLTIGKLAAMAENGQLFGHPEPVNMGIFPTYADFITTFGAQYYYILKDIADGQIKINDLHILRNFANDIIDALGFNPSTPNQK